MKITILSRRREVHGIDNIARSFRNEINIEPYGCLKYQIFKNQENEEVVTILSDWIDKSHFLKFEKSENYKNFQILHETVQSIDYELLLRRDSIVYSDVISESFSISRAYDTNYNETLILFKQIYTDELMDNLGILSINLLTVYSNERLVITLINWKDTNSYYNFAKNKPDADNEVFGEYSPDRYSLMNLVDTWGKI